MTNEQIIFNQSIELLKAGKINGTGEMITIKTLNEAGEEVTQQIEMPETIHTFQTWKRLGRKVVKGQHAVASFPIWKYTTRIVGTATNTETGEAENIEDSRCFMKLSHFFTIAQTELITR